ncbi:MAG: bifunctional diguanylate cyclase/phosphodiesterase [Kineosporiaceae bacterium]
MTLHWSIQQLTDYLSEISGQQDERAAMEIAVERAAEALDAEIAAVATDDRIRCSVGFGLATPPPQLLTAARAAAVLPLPGIGRVHAACSRLHRGTEEYLVVARVDDGLDAEELQILHGMAQMLGLALRSLRTLEAVQARQRLMATLLDVQRAISARRPLQDVLNAVTAGASALLGGWGVALVLAEPLNPRVHLLASRHGRHERDEAQREAAYAAAVTGATLAARSGMINAPVTVEGVVAGSLVAEVPPGLDARDVPDLPQERPEHGDGPHDLLTAFAQQVSLALTDARTVEALREAMRDPLTSLANRALFLDQLEQAFARCRRHGTRLTVVYLDLDGFKAVNDTSGHQAGDALLAMVAGRVLGQLRTDDVAARLGGDEFVLLLEGVDTDAAVAVTERVIAAIRAPFHVGDREFYIGASAGVATDAGVEGPFEMVSNADVAMYQAKQTGRARVVVFEPAMQVRLRTRLDLQADLRSLRAFHDFHLEYQPILALADGRPVGVEALLRWTHPRLGPLSPAEFVPLAEETGVIRDLGAWVLRTAAADIAQWRDRLPDLRLSVNVSARQVGPRLLDDVREVLATTGLPGTALTLELTETALMQDPAAALVTLERLRGWGVRLSIDDFGTGYSSLSYLRRFPVDEVKIDRSFVADVTQWESERELVRAVVDLGRALRLDVVAEGVETPEQLQALRAMGCERAQGFLWAEPVRGGPLLPFLVEHAEAAARSGSAGGRAYPR